MMPQTALMAPAAPLLTALLCALCLTVQGNHPRPFHGIRPASQGPRAQTSLVSVQGTTPFLQDPFSGTSFVGMVSLMVNEGGEAVSACFADTDGNVPLLPDDEGACNFECKAPGDYNRVHVKHSSFESDPFGLKLRHYAWSCSSSVAEKRANNMLYLNPESCEKDGPFNPYPVLWRLGEHGACTLGATYVMPNNDDVDADGDAVENFEVWTYAVPPRDVKIVDTTPPAIDPQTSTTAQLSNLQCLDPSGTRTVEWKGVCAADVCDGKTPRMRCVRKVREADEEMMDEEDEEIECSGPHSDPAQAYTCRSAYPFKTGTTTVECTCTDDQKNTSPPHVLRITVDANCPGLTVGPPNSALTACPKGVSAVSTTVNVAVRNAGVRILGCQLTDGRGHAISSNGTVALVNGAPQTGTNAQLPCSFAANSNVVVAFANVPLASTRAYEIVCTVESALSGTGVFQAKNTDNRSLCNTASRGRKAAF